jgi:predicted NUDIX family NTP pyrophosphohydrolase
MAGKQSAGLLLYRLPSGGPQVLLVHPGGPFWARRDQGAWSIPKGEYELDEEPLSAALREFEEELGVPPPAAAWRELGSVYQRAGKLVWAWAGEGDLDVSDIHSSTFSIEWPPRSGRRENFPEVDRAAWFSLGEAHDKLLEAQRPFLTRLAPLILTG